MISSPKLRWNQWRVWQMLVSVCQFSQRALLAIHPRLWRARAWPATMRLAYARVWLGFAGLLLLLAILLSLPLGGAPSAPYLSYDQIGMPQVVEPAAVLLPVEPVIQKCAMLFNFLGVCEP